MARKHDIDWFTCPVCGEVVREGALACPACGADDETGWSEDAEYDGVDLPDEAFGDPAQTRGTNTSALLLCVLALVVAIILMAIGAAR